jgi:hypothetical protein
MERLFLNSLGKPYMVTDDAEVTNWRPPLKSPS